MVFILKYTKTRIIFTASLPADRAELLDDKYGYNGLTVICSYCYCSSLSGVPFTTDVACNTHASTNFDRATYCCERASATARARVEEMMCQFESKTNGERQRAHERTCLGDSVVDVVGVVVGVVARAVGAGVLLLAKTAESKLKCSVDSVVAFYFNFEYHVGSGRADSSSSGRRVAVVSKQASSSMRLSREAEAEAEAAATTDDAKAECETKMKYNS